MKKFLLICSHLVTAIAGFALGIYLLPIWIAPPPPDAATVAQAVGAARYSAEFRRDLQDSDTLHWGEGRVSIGADVIALQGRVSPGPDYRVYLSPLFVETEADFMRHKADMVYVGDVKTFENFIVPLPARVRPEAYNTVIVWCEAFGQFISAAQYQP